MNDIEILEEMLKLTKKNKRGNNEIKFEVNSIYYIAIENLIQRNKELEQIEEDHKKENGRLREELEKIEYIKRNFDYCLERKTKELEKDISEMYYKGVVLDILQDELNISRDEAIEILENY